MSITAIDVPRCDQYKATSLSAWLSTHAAEAKLGSISVTNDFDEDDNSTLVLPLQQLTALQTLQLCGMEARTAGAGADADAEGGTAHAILMQAQPGLTKLDLQDCKVWLRGLHRLTGLQHLAVDVHTFPAAAAGGVGGFDNVAQLQQAIPHLIPLTALHLSDKAATDAALAHLSMLTCLQELKLADVSRSVTQASFQELPLSLTRLQLAAEFNMGMHADHEGPELRFRPSTTPGLCRLTALQELDVRGGSACFFHTSALPELLALRKLSLSSCPLTAAVGEPTLSVLAALTRLEYLDLPSVSGLMLSPAEYAAVTASPQLTYLNLSSCFGPQHAANVFPDNLRLPKLASLTVYIEWLQDTDTIQRIVNSCPGLQELCVDCHGGNDIAAIQPWEWAASLECLGLLSALTRLSMGTLDVRMTTEVFRAFADLTGLQELRLDAMDPNHLGTAVQLTSCWQLTKLVIGVVSQAQEIGNEFSVEATNMAPAGSLPDVWRQIPSLALQAAADYMETGEAGGAAIKSLLRATAQTASHALQRAADLERRVERLERDSDLERRVERLERKAAELQIRLNGLLRHLRLPEFYLI